MGKELILKAVTKSKVWQKLVKNDICGKNAMLEFTDAFPRYTQIPQSAASMTHIRGTYQNGSYADFLLFKDANGKRIGSTSFFPDGKSLEINIAETPFYAEHTNNKLINILGFKSNAKIYTRQSFLANGTSETQKTFSEVYKKQGDKRMFQFLIRTGSKKINAKTDKLSQEVIQIEKNNNLQRNFVKTDIEVTKDGTILNQSIKHSDGIHIDTKNPYYSNLLLSPEKMLQIQYSRIAGERGYKGIEPEIGLDRFSFEGQQTRLDVAKIYMNLKGYYEGWLTKSQLSKHLGHECEHLFEQATTIQRSGITDLIKPEYREYITFYDDVINRFGKIPKSSPEYKKAELYAKDMSGYSDKIYDTKGNIRPEAHSDLTIEKYANEKGYLERNLFDKCLANYKNNFSLFNARYANFNRNT